MKSKNLESYTREIQTFDNLSFIKVSVSYWKIYTLTPIQKSVHANETLEHLHVGSGQQFYKPGSKCHILPSNKFSFLLGRESNWKAKSKTDMLSLAQEVNICTILAL